MIEVREEVMAPFFTKWHLHGLPFAAVLHRFTEPDHGDFHSHPWPFRSFILSGGYVELVLDVGTGAQRTVEHKPGDSFLVAAEHVHRILALPAGECWTLIQPQGPKVQEPGFYQWRDGKPWHRFWHVPEFSPLS